MSIHRVKQISYDYDEHDEYADDYGDEGEDELDLEDKEQMKAGTAAVREELGADFPVSKKEIQDALWHYYYDVQKSVAYLKNRKKPPQQPKQAKQKQASRFDNAANAAASKAQAGNLNGMSIVFLRLHLPSAPHCCSTACLHGEDISLCVVVTAGSLIVRSQSLQ